ncbi:MAG: hypothetical protein AB7G93_20350 [Bdellovibrionales bacterium]
MRADLNALEQSLRAGDIAPVRAALKSMLARELQRADLLRVANLARRSGLIDFGLRLLNPIILTDRPLLEEATPEEKIEYAVLLAQAGAMTESRQILRTIDSQKYPEAILYTTFSLTPEWRYRETIPLLRKYLTTANNEYLKMVAEVNLIAALIFTDAADEAEELLVRGLPFSAKKGYLRLHGNLFELAAQRAILCHKYDQARNYLDRSLAIFKTISTPDSRYVEKWNAILNVRQDPNRETLQKLKEVRQKAWTQGEWETARDCDFHLAENSAKGELISHLMFGTPYGEYREKLHSKFSNYFQVPDFYVWHLGRSSIVQGYIESCNGKTGRNAQVFEVGQGTHRLFQVLCRDFYRPQRIADLNERLFPGEYFNPFSTPMRIQKACSRLRRAFTDHRIPIQVMIERNCVRLTSDQGFGVLRKWSEASSDPSRPPHIEELSYTFKSHRFTTKQAAALWGCSVSTATRMLRQAIAARQCQVVGKGRSIGYVLVKPSHDQGRPCTDPSRNGVSDVRGTK